jgi:hypothetical protein
LRVKTLIDIKPGELRCPRCFMRDIVPSLPRGWQDAVMRWFGRIPRHCRSCGKRFYVRAQEPGGQGPPGEDLPS